MGSKPSRSIVFRLFEIFGAKEQKEKTGKNQNFGEKIEKCRKLSEIIGKSRKNQNFGGDIYRSPLKTDISPIFRPKYRKFCSLTDTMEDFWRPIIQEEYSAIRHATVDANNFELKPALITMVQQHQFTGHPTEDPNEHLGRFLRMANTVKLNGVRPEVIKLHLFPFSLRDITATWYESLPYGSVDTWEELVEAYLGRFFPPSLISERRR